MPVFDELFDPVASPKYKSEGGECRVIGKRENNRTVLVKHRLWKYQQSTDKHLQ